MYTAESPLLASGAAPDAARIVRAVLTQPHGAYTAHDVRSIVHAYLAACAPLGLDPLLVIAQMLHETGNLSSFWAARPQRNPAGIGVTGNTRRTKPKDARAWAFNTQRARWEYGVSFASWADDAIPAHVGRLLAYALPRGAETPAQLRAILVALSYRALPGMLRGSAVNLRQLGQAHNPTGRGWASPGVQYGAMIAAVANRLTREA